MHDLPFMAHNEYVRQELGAAMGTLEEVDLDYGKIEWREFIRIRVRINITKPLLQRKKLNLGLSAPIWVSFSYKRLLNFYYYCEILQHSYKNYAK